MTIAERLAPYTHRATCPECGDPRARIFIRLGSELVCLDCYMRHVESRS
jgi:uncharacterized protein (UPF0212 family)